MPDIFLGEPSQPSQPAISETNNRKTSNTNNALSSYLFMPESMRFETQEPDETIILLLRKHWVTNAFWILMSIVLIIAPFIIFPLFIYGGINPQNLPTTLVTFCIITWYLLTFSYMLVNFLLWYFTVSIVTNERIIDIDFDNILNKKFSATRITKIEDVTQRTGGFIRSIFDYGDVIIQTAGTDAVFLFLAVPHPEKVVRTVNQLMEQNK